MTCKTGSAALLLSVLGVVVGAAASENTSGLAGNRGLSPIVVIGGAGTDQNPYSNMRKVLSGLGIDNYNAADHNSHFHIFLNPPAPLEIAAHLQADGSPASTADSATSPATPQAEAQGLLDYTQSLIEGEELMFTMDVPVMPAQETPIVLAQAATPGTSPQPDYLLNVCKETESTGNPKSAIRAVDPAGWLAVYIGNRDGRDIYDDQTAMSSIKITLLEGTTHGKLTSGLDNLGLLSYGYDAEPNYVGNDKAVFMAEFEGKRYKIVVELHVFEIVWENDPTATSCPPPKLIKVKKPTTGSSGYDMGSITVTFADLAGGAVGQAVGNTITLDDNAAGHNWFIDATPWDNSEYLPTSNPNEWVAKAGTAAYGKMDMLSVLFHEYGHALGIEHSADGHDYMGTTLTPGVRRNNRGQTTISC